MACTFSSLSDDVVLSLSVVCIDCSSNFNINAFDWFSMVLLSSSCLFFTVNNNNRSFYRPLMKHAQEKSFRSPAKCPAYTLHSSTVKRLHLSPARDLKHTAIFLFIKKTRSGSRTAAPPSKFKQTRTSLRQQQQHRLPKSRQQKKQARRWSSTEAIDSRASIPSLATRAKLWSRQLSSASMASSTLFQGYTILCSTRRMGSHGTGTPTPTLLLCFFLRRSFRSAITARRAR